VAGLTIYLRGALGGAATIRINGDVNAPYTYPESHGDVETTTAEGTLRGTTTRYTGIPIQELVARAEPAEGASMLLVEAADGYAFFISMEEVRDNESLLLAPQGKGQDRAYNVVGAENSKAWVRNVTELTVIGATKVEIGGALRSPGPYDPEAWQFEMDSAQVDLGDGTRKLQGAPLGDIIQSMQPTADADTLIVHTDDEEATLSLSDVLGDDDIRIFTAIDDAGVTYAVARMDGEVIAASVTHIEVIDSQ
jgi:DMSO/TMAO reductase YedYZ molybdopterin-dependent catalytic subunit